MKSLILFLTLGLLVCFYTYSQSSDSFKNTEINSDVNIEDEKSTLTNSIFQDNLTGSTNNTLEMPQLYHETNIEETGNFTDLRDGKSYRTVKIGNHWWLAENLAYLPSVSPSSSESFTQPVYYVYGYQGTNVNDAKSKENYSKYGVLYNWPAAVSSCPEGWHLPSDEEWIFLENYLIANGFNFDETTTENKIAKSMASSSGWNTSTIKGAVGNTDYPAKRNLTGFTAVPGGQRYFDGTFNYLGESFNYWSSTEKNTTDAWRRYIVNNSIGTARNGGSKEVGFSVRCIKDAESGLIAYYPFNGNANDESGNNNHGITEGVTPGTDRFGKENSAYYFDGINNKIVITDLKLKQPASFSCWIKTDLSQTGYIYTSEYSDSYWADYYGLTLAIQPNGTIHASFGDGSYPNRSVFTEESLLKVNQWHHIVVLWEETGNIKIYLDNEQANVTESGNSNLKLAGNRGDNDKFGADNYQNGGPRYFKGMLDDIKIFNRVLTPQDINNFYIEGGWYGNEDIILEIEPISEIFSGSEIYKNSESYFYCNIKPFEGLTYLENQRLIPLSSVEGNIPTYIKYLGNGILQFKVDFQSFPDLNNFTFELPDQVQDLSGATIKFVSIPSAKNITLLDPEVEQSIDLFGGGSLGAKLTAGADAGVVNISAASLSAEGSAGMGMTFSRKPDGDQFISRRLELGVAVEAKAPDIKAVVSSVDVVKVKTGLTGTAEQKMRFPADEDSALMLKAKAFSILETFSLGGIELSPMTALYINALANVLMKYNPDLKEIYWDKYYSTSFGVAKSFEAKAGLSFKLLENENCKISLGEFGVSTTFGLGVEINHQTDLSNFNLTQATEFNTGIFDFSFLDDAIELGSLLSKEKGSGTRVKAEFAKGLKFENFEISFETTSDFSVSILDHSTWNRLSFDIPRSVIARNLESENIIGFVAPWCFPGLTSPAISAQADKLKEYIGYYINDTPIELKAFDEYVSLSHDQSDKIGHSAGIKFELSAVVGFKFGLEYSYQDELKYPLSRYNIVKGKLLPVYEFEGLTSDDRLFTFKDEMYDLFYGTGLLIEEPLKELEQKIEDAIEAGKQFALQVFDKTVKITGTISKTGTLVIRKIGSAINRTKKSAFMGSQIIHAYTSQKVVNLDGTLKSDEMEATLYIISNNYDVSLLDTNGDLITDFDPINMSIATNSELVNELQFSENDLQSARMYYYDFENLTWVELEGDLNPASDTVETPISKSGTYAVGIYYNSSMDTDPVSIDDFFPGNLVTIRPNDTVWVKLSEAPIGSGIDFTRTQIIIDGSPVDAEWHPVTGMLKYIPEIPYEDGEHSFAVNVYDNNGNYSNVFSVFKVESGNVDYSLVMNDVFLIKCFPNPADEIVYVSVNLPQQSEMAEISLYNESGDIVQQLYYGEIQAGLSIFELGRNNESGARLQSGIYFIRYRNDKEIIVKKIIFI